MSSPQSCAKSIRESASPLFTFVCAISASLSLTLTDNSSAFVATPAVIMAAMSVSILRSKST